MIRPVEASQVRFSQAQAVKPAVSAAASPAVSALPTVQFEGLHADTVIGVRIPLDRPTGNKAFQKLVDDHMQTPFAHREVYLKRDPRHGDDVTVSLDRSGRQRVGLLPERLAKIVAPLMDEGDTRFHAVVTAMVKGREGVEPVMRLEMLTNPGRSPNVSRVAAFRHALQQENLPFQMEGMKKTRLGNDTLVHTVNEEMALENWYLNGHLLQRIDMNRPTFQPATQVRKRSMPAVVSEVIQRYSQATGVKDYANDPFKSFMGESQSTPLPPMRPLLDR